MEKITLYKEQLSRMRSMNRYYHDQFLLDVRILFIFNTVFIFLSLNNKNALYLIPLISLFGSVLLSFHAYFLIFSRHYSEFIEKKINSEYDEDVLIAHELENDYFFPTQERKIVVAVFNKGFTWFSFVTLFITLYGISSFIWSMIQIVNNDLNMNYIYLVSTITFITLVIGYWWFVSGTGEKRLERVFKNMDNKDFLEGTFDPYIGHEIVEIKENYVKSSLEVKDYHKQPMGMVHGGVIDTMAEAAISYAAYFTQEGTWVGVNNNTDFIRAITDGTIICEATPIKLGKRSQIWEAKIFNNDN